MTAAFRAGELVRQLAQEANTRHVNNAYRQGFVVASLILVRFIVTALRRERRPDPWSMTPGATLAFSMFKNERSAIDEHIAKTGCDWQHVTLDVNSASGLDFAAAALRAPLKLPLFLIRVVRTYGWGALRTYAHPFIGLLTFDQLLRVFRAADRSVTVVTTNMIHPMSLAIHYAAREAGLRTVFLEHAMTPRVIAQNRGYTRLLVRSPHTKMLLVSLGIPAETIDVLPYWQIAAQAPRVDGARIARVAFAVNDLDDVGCITQLAERLIGLGKHCEIRVHDSDRRLPAFRQLAARLGCEVSSAAGSSIFDFVRKQDLVIVGNSGVLLDCLRVGVPAIYFWSGDAMLFDYYGLAQYMQCPSARNADELISLLAPR